MANKNKGSRAGRNKIKCAQYAAEHRRVKNGPKLVKGSNGQIIRTPRTQRPRERTPH